LRVDFISRTDKLFDLKVQDTAAIGPRFGVHYMLTSDNRNAVRASWGRIHETLAQNVETAGTNVVGVREAWDTDLNGSFETVFITPSSTALASNRRLDEDRKQPRADEFTVGYRRQLPWQMVFDVSFLRREYRDRTGYIEQNGIYSGSVFAGYQDPTQNQIYLVTENTWNWPVYNGLELQFARQGRSVQVIASLSRQWRDFKGTWQPNDPASFIQPDAFPNDKGIGATKGSVGDANNLSGSSQARAQVWRDYSASVALSYLTPWGIQLATNYSYQSGLWSGPIVTRIAAPDPAFGPPVVILSNGRPVQNPLATTIRFVGPTRGDGQFTTDAIHVWNLRAGYTFRFGPRQLEAAVDFYNLANNGANQFLFPGANQTYNPFYKQGFLVQLPRSAQVSVRLAF
jgi:hypothetical protein